MKLCVFGATGLLGAPICRQLAIAGHVVRALVRSVDKARRVLGESVELVAGDALRDDDVVKAVEGCDGVVVSLAARSSAGALRVEHEAPMRILRFSKEKGLAQYVYISGLTAAVPSRSLPTSLAKTQTELALVQSGFPYTIIRPTWVDESLPSFVRGKAAYVIGRQPHPLHWIAADDLGRMVAAAFSNPSALDKTFFAFGPEPLTMRRALEVYCSIAEPGVEVHTVPLPIMRAYGLFSHELRGSVIPLMAYFNTHPEIGDRAQADMILGKPTVTVERWARALPVRG